jgi:hypothetical protein
MREFESEYLCLLFSSNRLSESPLDYLYNQNTSVTSLYSLRCLRMDYYKNMRPVVPPDCNYPVSLLQPLSSPTKRSKYPDGPYELDYELAFPLGRTIDHGSLA